MSARRVSAFVGEGAEVRVIAPWVCEDLLELVRAGRVEWQAREYIGAADLEGAWFVHTATGEPTDAQVRADAEASRVWCVDGTDARATAASLPARARVTSPDGEITVSAYAGGDPALARGIRDGVALALTAGTLDLRRHRPRSGEGWVALVGGGPGPEGLLTARGHELLASADVVVVDRLAPRGVVDRLPPSVRVIDVGKTPGHHAVPQDRINDILVEEAQRGHGVVRLKGGDPFVLGRGGEERDACRAHGIRVEVVPGVTSAVSVPAAAGIPVTHRGVARGFTVITGHDDVPVLPTGRDHTLVLLMAVSTLRATADLLVRHGRDASCPVAIVERGFDPSQRTTFGDLRTIADRAEALGVESPAVVVVGDVVTLSPEYPEVA